MTLTLDVFTLFFALYHSEVDNKTVQRETAANSKHFAVSYISEEEIQTMNTVSSCEVSPKSYKSFKNISTLCVKYYILNNTLRFLCKNRLHGLNVSSLS